MRILVAPDSFKGSLSAVEAAHAMAKGALLAFPSAQIDMVPIADGGEGTVAALIRATQGSRHGATVHDPLGRPISAHWGLAGNGTAAFVEMAAASGLLLLQPHEYAPRLASTFGTGQLILEALQGLHAAFQLLAPRDGSLKKPRLIIGIGGSATNDGGAGALKALGMRFLDKNGAELPEGGAALQNLEQIDLKALHPLLKETEILVACDVDNPLCGERGASAVFGPQKGADAAAVKELDVCLARYANVCVKVTGYDVQHSPGAGAAGGLGAGLLFFTGAQLVPGVQLVLETVGFADRVKAADLVITGEGCTDAQTQYGKAPVGVAKAAKKWGKPVLCVSGHLGEGALRVLECGIDCLASVCPPCDNLAEQSRYREHSMQNPTETLTFAVAKACITLRI